MRISLTGVPGTGKTTLSPLIGQALGLEVIHLTELARANNLIRGDVIDLEGLKALLRGRDGVLIESHYAELIPHDELLILRVHPSELVNRLKKRCYPLRKCFENALAEALDYYSEFKGVSVEVTGLSPARAAEKVVNALRSKESDKPNFTEWLDANIEQLESLGL